MDSWNGTIRLNNLNAVVSCRLIVSEPSKKITILGTGQIAGMIKHSSNMIFETKLGSIEVKNLQVNHNSLKTEFSFVVIEASEFLRDYLTHN